MRLTLPLTILRRLIECYCFPNFQRSFSLLQNCPTELGVQN